MDTERLNVTQGPEPRFYRPKSRRVSAKVLRYDGGPTNKTDFDEDTESIRHDVEKEKCAQQLGLLMMSKRMDTFILLLIIVYTIIVFANVSFEEEIDDYKIFINIVELAILSLFGLEIGLKIFAFGLTFLKDGWNIFDIIIVVICFILTCIDIAEPDLISAGFVKFSGILRLLRIVVMFRKVNEMRKMREKRKIKPIVKNLNFTSPAEQVIDIIEGLLCHNWIESDKEISSSLRWCIQVISSNKLYEVEVNLGDNTEGLNQHEEIITWVQQYSKSNAKGPSGEQSRTSMLSLVSAVQLPIPAAAVSNMPKAFVKGLEKIDSLDFNIFQFKETTEGQELFTIMLYLFQKANLFLAENIDQDVFTKFMKEVQAGYVESNTYHNATHAADVTQTYHYFMYTCNAVNAGCFNNGDVVACYLSACIHDLGHPGYNNNYLINSRDKLSIQYNDKSVLENFHVATAFSYMSDPGKNIFSNYSRDSYKDMRNKIIAMVLSTDFSRHFTDLTKFKNKFSNLDSDELEEDDKLSLQEMLMHIADISNPSKEWNMCKKWVDLLFEEYFALGDLERSNELPISYLCDRNSTQIASSQVGFISVIVGPTFEALLGVMPHLEHNMSNLESNKLRWEEEAAIVVGTEL